MGGNESQISPIPSQRYGDRFVRFISGITMSRERAEQSRLSNTLEKTSATFPPHADSTSDDPRISGIDIPRDAQNPYGTDSVMEKAERSAMKSRHNRGTPELDLPERHIGAVASPTYDVDGAILPVIGEAAESSSQTSQRGLKID
jgi:1-phosphatidylinositol-4-phosphate 5-kinase